MATYTINNNSASVDSLIRLIDPIHHFLNGAGIASQDRLEILNSDGTYTILNSSLGDFTYDASGTPTGGTITSFDFTDASMSVVYATATGLNTPLVDAAAAFTFNGLIPNIVSVSPTWADVIETEAGPFSRSSTLVIYENTDGTFTYVRGTGFTYNSQGFANGGTTSSVEQWGNSTETGSAMHSVSHTSSLIDLFDFANLPGRAVFREFFSGNDTINSSEVDDDALIWANSGDDIINGSNSSEIINAGSGDDIIFGNDGGDFIRGHSGNDTIYGGNDDFTASNYDTISYDHDIHRGGTAAVTVAFDAVTTGAGTAIDGYGDTDTFTGIEVARGTFSNDSFYGGGQFSRVQGLAGDDIFDGTNGARDEIDYRRDTKYNGNMGVVVNLNTTDFIDEGITRAFAQKGIDGFGDTDTLINVERIRGSFFDDLLIGSNTANRIRGEGGNDEIFGLDGNDDLRGNEGNDFIEGGAGGDTLQGGDGTDTLIYLNSTSGIYADLRFNFVDQGEATGDTISGFEHIWGSNIGGDTLIGSDVHNYIDGGGGNDWLDGQGDFDILVGNAGDDFIAGGQGGDILDGGTGADTLIYFYDAAGVYIDLRFNFADLGAATGDTINGFEHIWGSNIGGDTLIGSDIHNYIDGGGGNDWLDGQGGFDILVGNAGDDFIAGGEGGDILDGGTGADTLIYFYDAAGVYIDLRFNFADLGAATGDTISGFEHIWGSNIGADTLIGSDVHNYIDGGGGNDWIDGQGGSDILVGNGGADSIVGGSGNDFLLGGTEADNFYFFIEDVGSGDVDQVLDYDGTDTFWFQTGVGSIGIIDTAAGASYVTADWELEVHGATVTDLNNSIDFFA